ncbi:hypothetical protein [Clavibacter zhangzhiyongii]|uniref:hypothetical protein n=1 Tax=Clavibacter zhangzhiyongii TaxID=2768071 RepID=UPI0039E1D94F
MHMMRRNAPLALGAALAALGAAVTTLYASQPWRTCPSDDTAAGCGMLPGDAAVMSVAVLMALVGVIVLLAGVRRRWGRGGR